MKFLISRASGDLTEENSPYEGAILVGTKRIIPQWYVEIETLQDLIDLTKKVKADLVFSLDTFDQPEFTGRITIYDDYLE